MRCSYVGSCTHWSPFQSLYLIYTGWAGHNPAEDKEISIINGSHVELSRTIELLCLWSPHISVCDGHTFGLNGGLSGYAAPIVLQGHLPVRQSGPVRAGGPRGAGPVAIRRCNSVGGHVHGCHQVGQLAVVLRVQLRPAGGVDAHGVGWFCFTLQIGRRTRGGITALEGRNVEKSQNHTRWFDFTKTHIVVSMNVLTFNFQNTPWLQLYYRSKILHSLNRFSLNHLFEC